MEDLGKPVCHKTYRDSHTYTHIHTHKLSDLTVCFRCVGGGRRHEHEWHAVVVVSTVAPQQEDSGCDLLAGLGHLCGVCIYTTDQELVFFSLCQHFDSPVQAVSQPLSPDFK